MHTARGNRSNDRCIIIIISACDAYVSKYLRDPTENLPIFLRVGFLVVLNNLQTLSYEKAHKCVPFFSGDARQDAEEGVCVRGVAVGGGGGQYLYPY